MDWTNIKHFKSSEFDSPDLIGSGAKMDLNFIKLLDELRTRVGPLTITSGFRTFEHNKAVGGQPNSAHLYGQAADIACIDSSLRYHLIQNALDIGIKRFEIAPAHVHLDSNIILPQYVMVFLASYPPKV